MRQRICETERDEREGGGGADKIGEKGDGEDRRAKKSKHGGGHRNRGREKERQ